MGFLRLDFINLSCGFWSKQWLGFVSCHLAAEIKVQTTKPHKDFVDLTFLIVSTHTASHERNVLMRTYEIWECWKWFTPLFQFNIQLRVQPNVRAEGTVRCVICSCDSCMNGNRWRHQNTSQGRGQCDQSIQKQ